MTCKQLAKELGTSALQIGKVRKELFPEGQKGSLADEEVEAIRSYYEGLEESREEIEEAVRPKYVRARVDFAKAGRREAMCRLADDPSVYVLAFMPTGVDMVSLVGRFLDLEEIEYEGKRYYRHGSLSGYAWKPVLTHLAKSGI